MGELAGRGMAGEVSERIEDGAGGTGPAPAAAPSPSPDSSSDRPIQRILQVKGRRYSIRLEPIFWRVLEEFASSDRIRLNLLVGRVAESMPTGSDGNLTSCLRVFCAEQLRRRLMASLLPATQRNVFSIAEVSPAACLVVSARQEILTTNASFSTWFGSEGRAIVGHALGRHFRVRSNPPAEEVWSEFAEGRISPQQVRLISIAPGRVRAANALLQPIPFEAEAGFVCFVWLRL